MADDQRVQFVTRVGVAIILIATVALVCFVRLRLADVPLERDEGEYAYAGQLILKGVPPYQAAYNMKFPGAYYAYAAVMAVFGQTPWGIRVGLLAVHLATVLLLFVWGRRLVGTLAAGVGASAFALIALDRWSMGVFAHATHFVALPVVAGFALLGRGAGGPADQNDDNGRAWRLAAAGALMGLAVVMKQQAMPFAAAAVALAMWSARSAGESPLGREGLRRGGIVAAGIAASLVALLIVLSTQGVLGRFWFWTFQYASAYVSQTPAEMAVTIFRMAWGYITQATAWVWYLGVAGLAFLFVVRWPGQSRVVISAWVVAAMLAVIPGFFFRPHYFIVLMPVAGLLAGVTIASIDRVLTRAIDAVPARLAALLIFVVIAGLHIQRDRHFLFSMQPMELMQAVYPANPFLEAPEIARYLRANTTPDDRIAVMGSEPEILFYADRPSATGYIYMYALTERQPFASQMQDELMREVTSAKPKYVVLVDAAGSWVATLRPDNRVVAWANSFTSTCYDLTGVVDIPLTGPSTIRWDADIAGYRPASKTKVTIYRRQTGAGCKPQ